MRKYEREKSTEDKYDRERRIRKFYVVVFAKQLAVYTAQVTANEKYFPARYRLTFTDKMIAKSLDIVDLLVEANEILPDSRESCMLRFSRQREALAEFRSLETMIDVAKTLLHLPDNKVEYWSNLLFKARSAAASWYLSDRKRFGVKYRDIV